MENLKQYTYIISKRVVYDNKVFSRVIGGFSTKEKALKVLKESLDSGDEYRIQQIKFDRDKLEEEING